MIDAVGVHDDAARLGLAEDPREPDDGKTAGVDHIPQDISRAHAGELVHISDQDQPHAVRDGSHQTVHQHDVDHGALVHDQDVSLQRVFFVPLVAVGRLDFQQAVDGFGLHARGLGQALRGPPGRGGEQDSRSRSAKRRDDAEGGGRLACAGTPSEDEDLAFDGRQNRPDLDLVIVHARGGLDPPLKAFRANGHGALAAEKLPEPPGRARFGMIEGGKVDRFPIEKNVAGADHLIQRVGKQGGVNLEQLCAGFAELVPGGVTVTLVAQRIQRIHEAAAQPRVAVVAEAHLFGNGVGRAEADAPYVIGETIGVFPYHPDAVAAVGLIDLGGVGGAHVMPLEEEHDVLDLLLFHPALLNALHPDPADAGDVQQPVGRFLDDVQRVGTEGPDDPPGELWPDALDQTAAEILFDPVHGGGKRLLKALDRKLPPVLAVDPPAAPEGKYAAHMDLGHVPDDGDKVLVAPGAALENGVAVLFILIRNAFDHAAELFHDGSPAFPGFRFFFLLYCFSPPEAGRSAVRVLCSPGSEPVRRYR